MREFEGKVAVVTGAASGIGRALARRFAQEGMRVVLADVEQGPLEAAHKELEREGATAIHVATDVASPDAVESLARRAIDSYGAVHVLCNNAGVFGGLLGARLWEHSLNDWRWMLGVNLWGVVHGIRSFLPGMLRSGEEGHVVNTASLAGLFPGRGIYGVSKHAVVALSESLYQELAQLDAKVKVSVLCPGVVDTRIFVASRNRPGALRDPIDAAADEARARQERDFAERIKSIDGVLPPEEIAAKVLEGIREERFWILPHGARYDGALRDRAQSILERRNPAPRGPFDPGRPR
jgi:NAD(P)-dependent dehydrogenase (short-subunit alcohol dehydrogenase family)